MIKIATKNISFTNKTKTATSSKTKSNKKYSLKMTTTYSGKRTTSTGKESFDLHVKFSNTGKENIKQFKGKITVKLGCYGTDKTKSKTIGKKSYTLKSKHSTSNYQFTFSNVVLPVTQTKYTITITFTPDKNCTCHGVVKTLTIKNQYVAAANDRNYSIKYVSKEANTENLPKNVSVAFKNRKKFVVGYDEKNKGKADFKTEKIPKAPGKRFVRWESSIKNKGPYNSGTKITLNDDVTFTAVWEQSSVYVYYCKNPESTEQYTEPEKYKASRNGLDSLTLGSTKKLNGLDNTSSKTFQTICLLDESANTRVKWYRQELKYNTQSENGLVDLANLKLSKTGYKGTGYTYIPNGNKVIFKQDTKYSGRSIAVALDSAAGYKTDKIESLLNRVDNYGDNKVKAGAKSVEFNKQPYLFLFPVWEVRKYPITIDYNGGTYGEKQIAQTTLEKTYEENINMGDYAKNITPPKGQYLASWYVFATTTASNGNKTTYTRSENIKPYQTFTIKDNGMNGITDTEYGDSTLAFFIKPVYEAITYTISIQDTEITRAKNEETGRIEITTQTKTENLEDTYNVGDRIYLNTIGRTGNENYIMQSCSMNGLSIDVKTTEYQIQETDGVLSYTDPSYKTGLQRKITLQRNYYNSGGAMLCSISFNGNTLDLPLETRNKTGDNNKEFFIRWSSDLYKKFYLKTYNMTYNVSYKNNALEKNGYYFLGWKLKLNSNTDLLNMNAFNDYYLLRNGTLVFLETETSITGEKKIKAITIKNEIIFGDNLISDVFIDAIPQYIELENIGIEISNKYLNYVPYRAITVSGGSDTDDKIVFEYSSKSLISRPLSFKRDELLSTEYLVSTIYGENPLAIFMKSPLFFFFSNGYIYVEYDDEIINIYYSEGTDNWTKITMESVPPPDTMGSLEFKIEDVQTEESKRYNININNQGEVEVLI